MLAYGEITITEVFDGVSVSSVDVWFYPSTSQTTLIGGSWTTNAPQAKDGIWIWTKTITTLSNGTKKESSPTCVTGSKGAVGRSIDKIEEEYYLSSSKVTQTGGSWVKTPPEWLYGRYMWTRVKITYKNPTSVEYSIPICDSSWEAANGFKDELQGLITQNQTAISGVSTKVDQVEKSITNKVWKDDITTEINTYDSSSVQTIRNNVAQNKTEIGKITNTVSDVQSTLKTKADGSTVQTLTERVAKAEQDASGFKQTVEQNYVTKGDFDKLDIGGRNLLLESNMPNRNSSSTGYPAGIYNIAENLIEGETYTASVRATFSKSATWAMYIGGGSYGTQFHPVNGDGRKSLSITFKCTAEMATANQIANFYVRDKTDSPTAGEASAEIHWVKLEKGNKATDWTPAPEDIKNQMSSVKSELIQKADKIEAKVNTNTGDISSLTVTANGLSSDVATAKGDISTLKQNASTLTSQVQDAKKNISTLQQTSSTLTSQMSTAQGDISNLKQQADGFVIEVSKTMRTTQEEFYLSTSSTTLVGGSWSKVPPTWVLGKYIWRRTLVAYADGKTEYTPSVNGVCITGNTGATGKPGTNGMNGKDGKGIESLTNYYLATSTGSGVTTNTSGWTTSIQNTTVYNKYLWNYEKIIYTDKSVYQSNPCIIGTHSKDGINGQNGVGISSIIEYYQVSASNSSAPTSWQTTPPVLTPTNKYLWNYEKLTYTNGTTHETAKRVIGVYGDKGDRGLQGLQGIQGERGLQGVPGKDGTNGQTSYFHIKYSEVAKPTTASQMTETPSTYIGTYVDFVQNDSTDPNRYTWSRFAGAQGIKGENGIPGKNGIDGKTSYLHIAYANSADGRSGFDVSNSIGKLYIGQYTDFVQSDSTDPSKYSWTKIKGENGKDGTNGKGITSTSITYQASTSGTQAPTGTWQSSIPTVPKGQYLWSRTIVTYTDNTTSTSYSVAYIPTNGVNGQNGATGQTGTGVASIIQQYYLSTSKTTQTGGSWVTSMPTWSVGKYLWTRYQITYKNPTSTSYTSPVCDSSWDVVNDVKNEVEKVRTEYKAAIEVQKESINATVKKVEVVETTANSAKNKIDNLKVGGRNIVLESGNGFKNNGYMVANYNISPSEGSILSNGCGHMVEGEQYTMTICWTPGSKTKDLRMYLSTGYSSPCGVSSNGKQERQTASCTFNCNYTSGRTPADDPSHAQVALYRFPNDTGVTYDDISIHWIKIEKGNVSTEWTPAPEDVEQDIHDVHESAANAQSTANKAQQMSSSNEERITISESSIKQLSDKICTMVKDSNGSTVLTQSSTGFQFDLGAIEKNLNTAANDLNNLSGTVADVDNTIKNLNKVVDDLGKKTAYIVMTTDEKGQPCIELGKEDNNFKVRITNTSIDFLDGSSKIAYINNQSLYIEKAVIKSELQIGDKKDAQGKIQGFIWATRANGNMGLRKVGG